MKPSLPFALIFALACSACVEALPIENRPCPCAAGWQCCTGDNVCVREGTSCPATDGGVDGAVDFEMAYTSAEFLPIGSGDMSLGIEDEVVMHSGSQARIEFIVTFHAVDTYQLEV